MEAAPPADSGLRSGAAARADHGAPLPGRAQARALVLAASLLFSTGGAAIKLSSLSGVQIAGLRSGLAAALLWLCAPGWSPRLDARGLAVGAAYACTLILFSAANTLTTAASAIFLQASAPLYVLLLGPWLLGEPSRRSDWALVGLIAAGLAAIVSDVQPALRTAPNPALGNALALSAGASWALTLLGLRWLCAHPGRPGSDPTGSAVVSGNLLALLVCAPALVPLPAAQPLDWAVILYLGAVQVALAYLLLVRGLRGLLALESALLLCAEPALSGVWAFAIHGELPGPLALVGSALIGSALLAQALRDR
jgi:DME family drug/metabolite transporter